MSTYYVQKDGIYLHGVFWICNDQNEAIDIADFAASQDEDNYHEWQVVQYSPSINYKDDARQHVIYSVRKGENRNDPI